MTFKLLFVLMYLLMLGGTGPSRRNDGGSSSQLKGYRNDGESSSGINHEREKKDLSDDNFTIWRSIHEQSMELQDFDVVDGLLGCLEA